jgi:hypothetical protein
MELKQEYDPRRNAPGTGLTDKPDGQETHRPLSESTFNCVRCRRLITMPAECIERNGRHEHSFTNPHGFNFHIGCFADAPGVAGEGEVSDFWSWFPGYDWQVVVCRGCFLHLGWRFRNNDNIFFGLILARLIRIDSTPKLH